MSEWKKYFVLRVLYNNSDSMSDYYDPRRELEQWVLWQFEKKRVSEPQLRKILKDMPPWIRGLDWEYVKAARGRMCYPIYGSLDSKPLGPGVESSGGQSGIWFSITVASISGKVELAKNIPRRLEDVEKVVEARRRKRAEDRAYYQSNAYKSKAAKIQADQILRAHAVIGANGFEVLTPAKKIEKLMEIPDARAFARIHPQDVKKLRDWNKEVLQL